LSSDFSRANCSNGIPWRSSFEDGHHSRFGLLLLVGRRLGRQRHKNLAQAILNERLPLLCNSAAKAFTSGSLIRTRRAKAA
jgi:hypothetical protein